MDEFARFNLDEFRRAAEEGEGYTVPWLVLDERAYAEFRAGKRRRLPEPYGSDPANVLMMTGVEGKAVLLLAGGGGQQSAVFSLLGARVTVVDLTPEQLQADRRAAEHYGYPVTTIQGDMRDLSMLADGQFARVYQPISTLYVPDLRVVYRGVARVLAPGGRYYADFAVPLLYMAQGLGWDGQGYLLRVNEPYRRGALRETPEGRLGFSEGAFIGEYHHLLSDILNGLIEEGLAILGVWENPRPGSPEAEGAPVFAPGSEPHRNCYIPFGITVVAEKRG